MTAQEAAWLSIGFSENGEMTDSDVVILPPEEGFVSKYIVTAKVCSFLFRWREPNCGRVGRREVGWGAWPVLRLVMEHDACWKLCCVFPVAHGLPIGLLDTISKTLAHRWPCLKWPCLLLPLSMSTFVHHTYVYFSSWVFEIFRTRKSTLRSITLLPQ